MEKVCPSCKLSFVCKNDQITECWCMFEPINSMFRRFLAENFSDCLCVCCIARFRKNFMNYEHQIDENETI